MRTLGEMIERNARLHADQTALVYAERRLTHSQLAERARRFSGALYDRGLRRQDRVAILAMNCAEYYESYRACEWAGFILATVNFRLAPAEILYILEDAAPKALVFEAQYADVVDGLRSQLPEIEHYICIGDAPDWAVSFEAIMEAGQVEGPPIRSNPEDYAYLMYTSGTTGRPKGVVRTHDAMCKSASYCTLVSEFSGRTRVLQTTPAFHVGGIGFVNSAAWVGGTTVVHRNFEPKRMLETIEKEGITFTFMVAAMLQAVLDEPELLSHDLSTVENIVTAAAPVPPPLLVRGIEVLGPVFSVQYGMTESNGCWLPAHEVKPRGTPEEIRRLASVGRPCPGIQLRIVDDHGNDLPRGLTGEVWLRSETQFSFYWNNTAATVEALRDGWYRSGDMGYQDKDGYIFLVDRKKDMIISGGENIYSREVEDALAAHPAVVDVAVIGVPDEKWGECVKAIVVLRRGQQTSEAELIGFCRTLIANYKCPKAIEFVDELPRLPTGKISKVMLRKQFSQ
ncbi:class I adenylate-forming enzyme family protein [Paraburkholderia oxyphila]|uniref:class I adenylate-forming enzyme family protein n=1 Tax=Paraburkholderia oxyphila TaxID=614212 RepID=UPI000488D41D|nr:long-chain-fatty-acid--CoA ligase [Paraburkholderia oxyphila]